MPVEDTGHGFVWLKQRGSILATLGKIRSFKWVAVILAKNNEVLK